MKERCSCHSKSRAVHWRVTGDQTPSVMLERVTLESQAAGELTQQCQMSKHDMIKKHNENIIT